MTEEEARSWVRARYDVSRETLLARFVTLLTEEATRQNLVSKATLDTIWARHIVDSAQLVPLSAPAGPGTWVDIGSGAGLPGIVTAILTGRPTLLVEPRARRAAFLRDVAAQIGLGDRVVVEQCRIERFQGRVASVISARAVMDLGLLFAGAAHLSDRETLWLLPKGRNAQSEVEAARRAWQGSFHVEQSITQPDSLIVVAREVRPR